MYAFLGGLVLANIFVIYRRARKILKGDYWVRGVCLSIRPHVRTWFPLGGFL
jgi:hypothetical protein